MGTKDSKAEVLDPGGVEARDDRDATIERLEGRVRRLEQQQTMGIGELVGLHVVKHAVLPGACNKIEAAGGLAWRGLAIWGLYRLGRAAVNYFSKGRWRCRWPRSRR